MQQWCVVCVDDVRAEGDRSRPGVHCARRQTERDHIPIRGARTDESVQEDGIHGADQDYVSYRVSRRKLWHIGTSTCIAVGLLDSACHCMSPRWRCNVSVYLRLSITTLTLHFVNIILHTSPWRSSGDSVWPGKLERRYNLQSNKQQQLLLLLLPLLLLLLSVFV